MACMLSLSTHRKTIAAVLSLIRLLSEGWDAQGGPHGYTLEGHNACGYIEPSIELALMGQTKMDSM